jgi:hypothetical protein
MKTDPSAEEFDYERKRTAANTPHQVTQSFVKAMLKQVLAWGVVSGIQIEKNI